MGHRAEELGAALRCVFKWNVAKHSSTWFQHSLDVRGFAFYLHCMQARILVLVLALAAFVSIAADNIEVYFNPKGGATDAIARESGKARDEVLVEAYRFTSVPILDGGVACVHSVKS